MLTINADHHPLMSRMHKPDPKLPPDQQDKRSVIPAQVHTMAEAGIDWRVTCAYTSFVLNLNAQEEAEYLFLLRPTQGGLA